MAKTLRVRTRTGWVTKPVADEPENRLIAEEVDDNFLALEDQIANIKAFEIGQAVLATKDLAMPGWLDMDGTEYATSTYPTLGALLHGPYTIDTLVSGSPSLPNICDAVALSPDGTYLAAVFDSSPYLRVYNTSDWSVVSGTPTLGGAGRSLAFSSDGSLLAAGHTGANFLTVINTSDWSVVAGTPSLAGQANDLAFSPSGTHLAAAVGSSPYLQLYLTSTWASSTALTLAGVGRGVEFSPDGRYLLAGHATSPYFTVMEMTLRTAVTGTPTLPGTGYRIGFSKTNKKMFGIGHAAGSGYSLMELDTWNTVPHKPNVGDPGEDVAFSPDGTHMAIGHWGGQSLTIIRLEDWSTVSNGPLVNTVHSVVFGKSGEWVAVGQESSPYLSVIRVHDTATFIVPHVHAPRADLVWRIKAE